MPKLIFQISIPPVYADDVSRIVDACKREGLEIGEADAYQAWNEHSELNACRSGWQVLPADDRTLVDVMRDRCGIQFDS